MENMYYQTMGKGVGQLKGRKKEGKEMKQGQEEAISCLRHLVFVCMCRNGDVNGIIMIRSLAFLQTGEGR
jgi:hypothetical protein